MYSLLCVAQCIFVLLHHHVGGSSVAMIRRTCWTQVCSTQAVRCMINKLHICHTRWVRQDAVSTLHNPFKHLQISTHLSKFSKTLPSQNFYVSWFLTIFRFLFLTKESMLHQLKLYFFLFFLLFFLTEYPENAKYPPDKNCESCSRHKIIWKLAHLSIKMTSLIQNTKLSAYPGIYKNCIPCSKT